MRIINYFKEPFENEREKNIILGALIFPIILFNLSFSLAWVNNNTKDINELVSFVSGTSPDWMYTTAPITYIVGLLFIHKAIKFYTNAKAFYP
jgi:hypothetical protein